MEKKELSMESKMEFISGNDFLSERLASKLLDAIQNDEETLISLGRSLISAYESRDPDMMLIALCGWSMETLAKKTISVKAYAKQGDLVTCSYCGSLMLVSSVADVCPCCFAEDTMDKIYIGDDSMENLSIQTLKRIGYELDREAPAQNYDFDFLVLTRSKDKEDLKTKIESHIDLKVISINEEDFSYRDNEKENYKQADLSLLVDFNPGDNENFCMATLYYYIDRMGQIVITGTAFDWG